MIISRFKREGILLTGTVIDDVMPSCGTKLLEQNDDTKSIRLWSHGRMVAYPLTEDAEHQCHPVMKALSVFLKDELMKNQGKPETTDDSSATSASPPA